MLERLIVLVEEPSMEATVEHLLPKLMNDVDFEIRRFQCKDDLLKNLPDRLCGYSTWLPENWAILVLVDRDDDDCMSIAEFIRESVLRPRLQKSGCLVVYDADKRYREQCFDLGPTRCAWSIRLRAASRAARQPCRRYARWGSPKHRPKRVLIYVPRQATLTDEQKQVDPFALYAECGAVFPQDDGDEYLSLCLRAKPDHATDIRRVFADHRPALHLR
jgi:hypothetical protein